MANDYTTLPPDLPVPEDDGAADHLTGARVPSLSLPSSQGGTADLAGLAQQRLVAYVYPRTGTLGRPSPAGWDDIPGARGCTPQSCAFRDSLAEFTRLGASVAGISAQNPAEQREFAEREYIPFALLSDDRLKLADRLGLPTFEVEGVILYRRLTFIAEGGCIVKVSYPVFPPDRNADEVLAWLTSRPAPSLASPARPRSSLVSGRSPGVPQPQIAEKPRKEVMRWMRWELLRRRIPLLPLSDLWARVMLTLLPAGRAVPRASEEE